MTLTNQQFITLTKVKNTLQCASHCSEIEYTRNNTSDSRRRRHPESVTFGIHATMQGGISEMLGESRMFSDSRDPSKLHPSSCSLPILTLMRAALTEPDQQHANLRPSIEHFISLQHHSTGHSVQSLYYMFIISVSPPSNRHHRSNGDCLEGKRENYQVCSVQHCVQELCTVKCTHI